MALKTSSIEQTQKWIGRAGLALLAVSVCLTTSAGYSMGEGNTKKAVLYALMMGIATIGAALLLPFIEALMKHGRYVIGALVFCAWSVMTFGESAGHLMAIGGDRHQSIQVANVADERVEGLKDTLHSTKQDIATLESIIVAREKSPGFTSTKTSDAWAAELGPAKLAADLEAKRGGCMAKCLDLRRKVAEIEANMELAKQDAIDRARLAQMKEKRDDLQGKVNVADRGNSAVRTQADNLVQAAVVLQGGWTEKISDDARARANFGLELLAILIMVVGPMSMIYCSHVDWTPRHRTPLSARIAKAVATVRKWRKGEFEPARTEPAAPLVHAEPVAAPAPTQTVIRPVVEHHHHNGMDSVIARLTRTASAAA